MKILSIDLASKRYQDLGLALLDLESRTLSFPQPEDLGLAGAPVAAELASAVDGFCRRRSVRILLLDGPQAWRHPRSPIPHMRLAERVLNTPARTGNPGEAKPRTILAFISFSIALFEALRLAHGWALLDEGWERHRQPTAVETFPSAAWRLLGLPPLPSKGRTDPRTLEGHRRLLEKATGYALPDRLNHDQLQAAAVLPVGEALAARDPERLILCGVPPIAGDGGLMYEGWIACPRLSAF